MGEFYVVNERNCITGEHIDPEAYARELGVLKPWETAPDFE